MDNPRFDDLIGKPYLEGACGPDKFDCYGLTIEVFKRLHWPLDIPADILYNFGSRGWSFLKSNPMDWRIIDTPAQIGDLALIRGDHKDRTPDGRHYARHLAIFIGEDKFLHCVKKTGVGIIRWKCLDPFTLFIIRHTPQPVHSGGSIED